MILKIASHLIIAVGHLLSVPLLLAREALGIQDEEQEPQKFHPLSVQTQYLHVNPADFKTLPYQRIEYQQVDSTFSLTLPATLKSGFLFSCGYLGAKIDWSSYVEPTPVVKDKRNEWLGYRTFKDCSYYHYLLFSTGAYTQAMNKWLWSVLVSGMIDPKEAFHINYSWFQGAVSGKYEATECMDAYFGLLGEAGLKETKIRPLIGVSYRPDDKLTIHCIYPINFSAEYRCTKVCTLATAFRFTRFRKKLYQNEWETSKGFFEYQGRAVEASVKLFPTPNCSFKVFYGISIGNNISLSNAQETLNNTYSFKESSFYGGSAALNF